MPVLYNCQFIFQLSLKFKIGLLYCKAGQSTEEQMYNNGEILAELK